MRVSAMELLHAYAVCYYGFQRGVKTFKEYEIQAPP